jgi:DNA adenine methylase
MGSKNRIAKELLPIILKDRTEEQWYVEPFVGGCNMIDKVSGLRMAGDYNKHLIAMWQGLQTNITRPYDIPKELYVRARTEFNQGINEEFDDFMIGWIGWMASFNGRFFDGGYSGKTATRDYVAEQIRNTEKQFEAIQGIVFQHATYYDLDIPENAIIYCDIPYKDTKQYASSKGFSHDDFWQWAREKSLKGNQVFISEYQAPEDFTCVWEKKLTNSMNITKTYTATERLFVYRP